MDSFHRRSRHRQKIEHNSMDADSDSSDEPDRPFSPPALNDRAPYLPDIVQDCPGSAVSRKLTDGFREIEICSESEARLRAPTQIIHVKVINETKEDVDEISSIVFSGGHEAAYDNETFEDDEDDSNPADDDETPVTDPIPTDTTATGNSGHVLIKLPKEQPKIKIERTGSEGGGDDSSRKYGVTMIVKSGVRRTPWREISSVENSTECPSKGKRNEVVPLKRSSTEETVLPSTSSSMDSVIRETTEFGEVTDETPLTKMQSSRTITSQMTEAAERGGMSTVSLATYTNIQKEGGPFKRGNCILCTMATITFVVTVVLTVCLLIAPKTFAKKYEPPIAEELLRHINNPGAKLPGTLHIKSINDRALFKSNHTYSSIDLTNSTRVIPNR